VFFSQNGKYAGYIYGLPQDQYRPRLGVMDVATGKKMGDFEFPLGADAPRFSPDERAIQFLLTRNGARNVWAQPLGGGDLSRVTAFTSGDATNFTWSPDGRDLFISRGITNRDVVLITNFH